MGQISIWYTDDISSFPTYKEWRDLDHEMLLTEPLLSCPCCVFGVIVMLEDPATTLHLQCSYWGKEVVGQNLVIHGPIHAPLNTVQSSCPLCRKAPPKHDVSTPCFTVGMVFLGSSKHSEWSLKQKVIFWSHLTTWPAPMPPHPDGLWQIQTGLDMCWLEQWDLAHAAGF